LLLLFLEFVRILFGESPPLLSAEQEIERNRHNTQLAELSRFYAQFFSAAREFFDAYVKRTEMRYPGATQLSPTDPQNRKSELETQDRRWFSTNEGAVTIELRGNRVAILEGQQERADARGLLKTIWAQSFLKP